MKKHYSHTNQKDKNKERKLQEIQKILEYFVAEGIAYEVSPGQYSLTKEGRELKD